MHVHVHVLSFFQIWNCKVPKICQSSQHSSFMYECMLCCIPLLYFATCFCGKPEEQQSWHHAETAGAEINVHKMKTKLSTLGLLLCTTFVHLFVNIYIQQQSNTEVCGRPFVTYLVFEQLFVGFFTQTNLVEVSLVWGSHNVLPFSLWAACVYSGLAGQNCFFVNCCLVLKADQCLADCWYNCSLHHDHDVQRKKENTQLIQWFHERSSG